LAANLNIYLQKGLILPRWIQIRIYNADWDLGSKVNADPCDNMKADLKHWYIRQTWALALYFQVCSPLSAHFLSMDRYRSIAHFADFQVRSSLNRSKKTSGLLLEKSAKMLNRS